MEGGGGAGHCEFDIIIASVSRKAKELGVVVAPLADSAQEAMGQLRELSCALTTAELIEAKKQLPTVLPFLSWTDQAT